MLPETMLVLKLVLALALGSMVGAEREFRKRPAGLRTHVLVCMGAALFTSLPLLAVPLEDPSASARVLAGIITGIGFLGAGAIIHHNASVEGLTTAADIWVVSAIGATVGLGYYIAALAASLLVFAVLWLGLPFKKAL